MNDINKEAERAPSQQVPLFIRAIVGPLGYLVAFGPVIIFAAALFVVEWSIGLRMLVELWQWGWNLFW